MSTTTPQGKAKPPGPPVHATLIPAIICVSYFMVILDNSIVFTGLPQIRTAMGFSETGLSWITNAYVLVFGGLLLLGARAGDVFGHRRVFLFSLTVFSLASLLVGAAQSQWWLIGARALQGVGAAVMMVLAVRFLPETTPHKGRFDVAGALLATLGSTALVLGIVDAADGGWSAPATVIPLAGGAAMLGLFVRVERRAAQPIVPLRLFASRERSGAYLTRMLYTGAMMGFFFFTAQFVQSVYHWTPLQAGLAFLPMTLVNFAFAVQVPRLLERVSRPTVLLTGVTLTAVGMLWPSRLGLHTTYLTGVAPPMVLIGAGQGLALAPLTSSGMEGVAPADAGAGSGLVNAVHQIGSALSLSILTAGAADVSTGHGAADVAARSGVALTGSAVLLAFAAVAVLALILPARGTRHERTF
ncbi:MFS transporter [Streptomyces sp. YJ-C3]